MRARAMAALAIAAIPAAFATAGGTSNLITSLQMSAPAPVVDPIEGIGVFEDFEGFALGAAGQFGWLTNSGTIVNSGVAGFGARTASANVQAGGVGFVASPDFGPAAFGLIAADLVATLDDGTTYGFETDHIDSGTINTRVLLKSRRRLGRSSTPTWSKRASVTARSMQFCSSRTLPGQS